MPEHNFTPIPGDSKRRAIDYDTGEVISRRKFQTLEHQGKSPEQYANERLLTGLTTRGRQLYNHDVYAFANKYNISAAAARSDPSFKFTHSEFRKELKHLDQWRNRFFKENGHMPRKNDLAKHNPNLNKRLNELSKDLGKKGVRDYSDFGSTPTVT